MNTRSWSLEKKKIQRIEFWIESLLSADDEEEIISNFSRFDCGRNAGNERTTIINESTVIGGGFIFPIDHYPQKSINIFLFTLKAITRSSHLIR